MTNELQSWWEVPAIAYFCNVFQAAFGLFPFEIEELEAAFLPQLSDDITFTPSATIEQLFIRLLEGCASKTKPNYENWLEILLKKFKASGGREELSSTISGIPFSDWTLRTKVEVLYSTCELRLDYSNVDQCVESDAIRVQPVGEDSKSNTYWYFFGLRLYKEDSRKLNELIDKSSRNSVKNEPARKAMKKKKNSRVKSKVNGTHADVESDENHKNTLAAGTCQSSGWQIVCKTKEDWDSLVSSLNKSRSPKDKQLVTTIEKLCLPIVLKEIARRESVVKKKLIELAPRRVSARIDKVRQEREKEAAAAEQEKLRKQEEEQIRREKAELEKKKNDSEMRAKRAAERERAIEERAKRAKLRELRVQDGDLFDSFGSYSACKKRNFDFESENSEAEISEDEANVSEDEANVSEDEAKVSEDEANMSENEANVSEDEVNRFGENKANMSKDHVNIKDIISSDKELKNPLQYDKQNPSGSVGGKIHKSAYSYYGKYGKNISQRNSSKFSSVTISKSAAEPCAITSVLLTPDAAKKITENPFSLRKFTQVPSFQQRKLNNSPDHLVNPVSVIRHASKTIPERSLLDNSPSVSTSCIASTMSLNTATPEAASVFTVRTCAMPVRTVNSGAASLHVAQPCTMPTLSARSGTMPVRTMNSGAASLRVAQPCTMPTLSARPVTMPVRTVNSGVASLHAAQPCTMPQLSARPSAVPTSVVMHSKMAMPATSPGTVLVQTYRAGISPVQVSNLSPISISSNKPGMVAQLTVPSAVSSTMENVLIPSISTVKPVTVTIPVVNTVTMSGQKLLGCIQRTPVALNACAANSSLAVSGIVSSPKPTFVTLPNNGIIQQNCIVRPQQGHIEVQNLRNHQRGHINFAQKNVATAMVNYHASYPVTPRSKFQSTSSQAIPVDNNLKLITYAKVQPAVICPNTSNPGTSNGMPRTVPST